MTLALTSVDGRTVAKAVKEHQAASAEHARAIGAHDSYGSYYPAGETVQGSGSRLTRLDADDF